MNELKENSLKSKVDRPLQSIANVLLLDASFIDNSLSQTTINLFVNYRFLRIN